MSSGDAALATLRAYAGPWSRACDLWACHLLGRTPGPRWLLQALEDALRRCGDCRRVHPVCAGAALRDSCPLCHSLALTWVNHRGRPVEGPRCEAVMAPRCSTGNYSLCEWSIDFSHWAERVRGRGHLEALTCVYALGHSHREAARALGINHETVRDRINALKEAWGGVR